MIEFQDCVNSQNRYFLGCSMLGIIFGSLSIFILWPLVHLSIGFGSSFPVAMVGNYISKHLHAGNIQKWMYWNLGLYRSLPRSFVNRYL